MFQVANIITVYFIFNHIGNSVVAFYDERMLPSPTIRHASCTIFIDEGDIRCLKCDSFRYM